ncbi:MAG: AraC family transcriptional regulator, partial [Anaerolineaceae bacterium]
MSYINITVPPFPCFIFSGNAIYRPGDNHPRRSSIPCFDLILVEEGELYMTLYNKQYTVSENCVLIIPPKVPHYGHRIGKQKTVFHWVHFSDAVTYEISETPVSNHSKHPKRERTYDILHDTVSLPIYQVLNKDMANQALSTTKLLETLSINLFEQSHFSIKSNVNLFHQQEQLMRLLNIVSIVPMDSDTNDIAYKCMQYITSHYAEPFQLSTLAEISNCHPTHVIRCMKKQYGKTPSQIANHIRLQRACEMLKIKEMSITTIAYASGFSSPSYFCKQFKTAY